MSLCNTLHIYTHIHSYQWTPSLKKTMCALGRKNKLPQTELNRKKENFINQFGSYLETQYSLLYTRPVFMLDDKIPLSSYSLITTSTKLNFAVLFSHPESIFTFHQLSQREAVLRAFEEPSRSCFSLWSCLTGVSCLGDSWDFVSLGLDTSEQYRAVRLGVSTSSWVDRVYAFQLVLQMGRPAHICELKWRLLLMCLVCSMPTCPP